MKRLLIGKWTIPVAGLILALSIGSAAFAATGSSASTTPAADATAAVTSSAATTHAATATDAAKPTQRTDETPLTGTTLDQVKAAALAKVGSDATVVRVETDADGNAAYEAHMQKADGTQVTVYVDESFNVVSVEDQPARGHGGGHGGQRTDETLLTGTTLDQVKAAALAKVGSDATVVRVETDADGNAAYEAHMQKADGTKVTVYVDESFNVVSVEDHTGQRPWRRPCWRPD